MKKYSFKTIIAISIVFVGLSCKAQKIHTYPVAPKDSIYDTYFDTTIYDPYQWMENPDDPRLKTWLDQQYDLNEKVKRKQGRKRTLLAQTASMYQDVERKNIKRNTVKENRKQTKYEFKFEEGSYKRFPDLYYRERGQIIYKKLLKIRDFENSKEDNPAVEDRSVNEKKDIVAIEISHSGGDWHEIHFYDLKTGNKMPDTLKFVRGSVHISWFGNGLYYDRYEAPEEGKELLDIATGQKLCYHKIGTSQNEDVVMYRNPDTSGATSFSFFKRDSLMFLHHYLFVQNKSYKAIGVAPANEGVIFDLQDFIVYPDDEKINLSIQQVLGDTVLIKSNWNAPNNRVLMASITEKNKLSALVPEYDVPLFAVNKFGKGKIACIYKNAGAYMVLIYSLQGELLKKIDFPEGKKLTYFYENSNSVKYTTFHLASFYHPSLIFQISLDDFKMKPIQEIDLPYNPYELETRYVEYASKDGTKIPMYITCKKNTKINGKNPTILYGYGGYGHVVEPYFDESLTLWILHGGILAVPNIRGGGAKGSDWGMEGRRLKKQNAIDDFIAAAEYLINNNYTSNEKLAIKGSSHGGLLVGAALTQRPELYKCALVEAGVLDMLRFNNFTVGAAGTNINEFGDVAKEPEFNNLLSYSPLHNIKKGVKYPNVLLITGDKDDRVPPLHSYKFLATLQDKGAPESLYQMYVIPGAGHQGAVTNKEFADVILFKYYYLYIELGLKFW